LDLPMPTAENKARISRRGWCITERALSNITKISSCCLTLTKENQALIMEALNWYVLADTCRASRTAPVSPGVFKQMLEEGMDREKAVAGSGIVFTNGKDATSICIPQYEEAFMRLFASAKALSYSELGWGEAAAEELAVAFQYLHARTGGIGAAEYLSLHSNQLTDAAITSLSRAFSLGALPSLTDLRLNVNQIGDVGAVALAEAMTKSPMLQLKKLKLEQNRIGNRGAAALAASLRRGAAPSLEKLLIGSNAFDEAARADLAEACKECGTALLKDYKDGKDYKDEASLG